MLLASMRRGAVMAATLVGLALASCETPAPPPPAPPPPPPPPPPAVMLNSAIADAAASYVAFIREVRTLNGGFQDAASIQAAMRKGSAYSPEQLSRGMIAYGAVIALQSPDYVAGVRTFAGDQATRRGVIDQIVADPAYAAQLPGAEMAAGLITTTLNQDIAAIAAIAESIEGDAYTIQERQDPRRAWAVVHIVDRESRLEATRALAANPMLPSADEAARLMTAANTGTGLGLASAPKSPPYTPAVIRSLAIAALSALGAGGEEWRPNHLALAVEPSNEFCLTMSKLNLYQCLAASRPHYEDIFCVGRHIVRDLATCAADSVGPPPRPIVLPTPTPVLTAESSGPATTTALNAAPQAATPTSGPTSSPVPYQASTETAAATSPTTTALNATPATAGDGPVPYQPSAEAAAAPATTPAPGPVPPQGVPVAPSQASDTAVPYTPGPN